MYQQYYLFFSWCCYEMFHNTINFPFFSDQTTVDKISRPAIISHLFLNIYLFNNHGFKDPCLTVNQNFHLHLTTHAFMMTEIFCGVKQRLWLLKIQESVTLKRWKPLTQRHRVTSQRTWVLSFQLFVTYSWVEEPNWQAIYLVLELHTKIFLNTS